MSEYCPSGSRPGFLAATELVGADEDGAGTMAVSRGSGTLLSSGGKDGAPRETAIRLRQAVDMSPPSDVSMRSSSLKTMSGVSWLVTEVGTVWPSWPITLTVAVILRSHMRSLRFSMSGRPISEEEGRSSWATPSRNG